MKNIRELKFTIWFVDAEYWNVISTLGSLEGLSFNWCKFLQGPADVEPKKRVRVKVSSFWVVHCTGLHQPVAAIDARYLRTFAMDITFFGLVDWLSQSAFTEIHGSFQPLDPFPTLNWYMHRLDTFLIQAHPYSIKVLSSVLEGIGLLTNLQSR